MNEPSNAPSADMGLIAGIVGNFRGSVCELYCEKHIRSQSNVIRDVI